MQKLKQKIREVNKVFAIALLASVLAIPLAVHTYAQNDDPADEQQTTQTTEQEPEAQPVVDVLTDATTPESAQDQTETDETNVVEEEETPTPTEISITDAIAIAQAEHSGVEVVMAKVKLKNLGDEKVYKIVFADGWRLYVRASDGEIVRIKDKSNKKHDCSKHGEQAVANWRAMFEEKWGHKPGNHGQSPEHRKNWWYNSDGQQSSGQSDQQNEQEQPAETETPAQG